MSWLAKIGSILKAIDEFIVFVFSNKNDSMANDLVIPPSVPPPAPAPVVPAFAAKISLWAKAIQVCEGGRPTDRNMVNNNPGNLRFTPYTRSLGAINHDKQNFCVFPAYGVGFHALCQFLKDAANNLLTPYHNVTLAQFTHTYAEPPNDNYVNTVARALGVSPSIKISELLK